MTNYEEERAKLLEGCSGTFAELCARRSVRIFEDRDISAEDRQRILLAAAEAPSAGCQQFYTILDVRSQELKEKLAVSCDNQPFIATAPMVLVFCADCRKWYDAFAAAGCEPRNPGVGDLLLAVADTAIAAQNAVTAAWSMGIGSCYIGDILEQYEIHREILELPDYVVPAVMAVFGYPEKSQLTRAKPLRIDMDRLVAVDTYPVRRSEDLKATFENRCGGQDYIDWMKRFCARKYNSDFSREMTRSVVKYIEEFK